MWWISKVASHAHLYKREVQYWNNPITKLNPQYIECEKEKESCGEEKKMFPVNLWAKKKGNGMVSFIYLIK